MGTVVMFYDQTWRNRGSEKFKMVVFNLEIAIFQLVHKMATEFQRLYP